MQHDPTLYDAVFLGPSLDVERARAILPANYYPPVRMGDIYRLLATGVRRIAIIDGVFHATTPVWPREILAALQAGIEVIGASSMGALRALELEPYGMTGCGQVYRWYRDGVIEGDDEVALLHATAELGYLPLNQPLVDLRHDLALAVADGVISGHSAAALLAQQKSLCFTDRGSESLQASDVFRALPARERRQLADFLRTARPSLKELDALEALQRMAARPAGGPVANLTEVDAAAAEHEESCPVRVAPAPLLPRPAAARIWRRPVLLMRGIPGPGGALVPMGSILENCADRAELAAAAMRAGRRRFYLLEWLGLRGVEIPQPFVRAYRAAWCRTHAPDDLPAWCRDHGLTRAELDGALAERAAEDWLLQHAAPADFGLQEGGAGDPAVAYLADWIRLQGLTPPDGRAADAEKVHWLLAQEPGELGFDHWSAELALIRELQLTSALRRFLPAPAQAVA